MTKQTLLLTVVTALVWSCAGSKSPAPIGEGGSTPSEDDANKRVFAPVTTPDQKQADLKSLHLVLNEERIPVGASEQIQALGLYSDEATRDLTHDVKWSVSDVSKVYVAQSTGWVTAIGKGTVTIKATLGDFQAEGTIEVYDSALRSLSLVPSKLELLMQSSRRFNVMGTYSDGSSYPLIRDLKWSVVNPKVLTLGVNGEVTALSAGKTTIKVGHDLVPTAEWPSASVSVPQMKLKSIVLVPGRSSDACGALYQEPSPKPTSTPSKEVSQAVGSSEFFHVLGNYDNDRQYRLCNVAIVSSDAKVASIDGNEPSLVRYVGKGDVALTARLIVAMPTPRPGEPQASVNPANIFEARELKRFVR